MEGQANLDQEEADKKDKHDHDRQAAAFTSTEALCNAAGEQSQRESPEKTENMDMSEKKETDSDESSGRGCHGLGKRKGQSNGTGSTS